MSFQTPKILKKKSSLFLVALILAASLFIIHPASASIGDRIGEALGSIIYLFIWALGQLLILVIWVLVKVASYQNFIKSGAVAEGWVIVRDLSNMFFVVVLLIIAFSTILHLENYSYKKWLPKLILMAILINFSKTICGLMIDVVQIVMLTFVNAFKDIAGGNIIDMLGIKSVITFARSSDDVGFGAIVGAYILALLYVVIALVVMITMLMMLVMRIVMIWIYVVLSPLAYLMSAFPGGAQYASQWWKEFIQNLVVGPVIAFFIWLAFAALQNNNYTVIENFDTTGIGNEQDAIGGAISSKGDMEEPVMLTEASTPGVLIKFIIGIGMLIGGLKIAQQVGGAAGAIAGKGMGKLNKLGAMGAGAVGGFALGRAKWAGRQALAVPSKLAQGAGSLLGKTGFGKSLKNMGDIGMSYRSDLIASNKKSKIEKRKKFLEKIGVGAKTADRIDQDFGKKNRDGQSTVTGINAAATLAVAGSAFGPLGTIIGAAVGSGIGWGLNKMSKARDSKIDDAKKNAAAAQVEYDESINPTPGFTGPRPAPDVAAANLKQAKDEVTRLSGSYVKGSGFKGVVSQGMNQLKNLPGVINASSTEYTAAAAKKVADVEVKAKQQVESASKDPGFLEDASPSGLYSSNGQQDNQEAFVRHLADDDTSNTTSAAARTNLTNWVKSADSSIPKQGNVIRALAKDIAATGKKGDIDIGALTPLINAINGHAGNIGNTVEGYKASVISYRETEESGEKGTGGVYVDSFAKGKNAGGSEVLGADFEKLRSSGVNISATAEGAHIEPEDMKQVADALIKQIQEAKINLESKRAQDVASSDYAANKDSYDKKYEAEKGSLDQAEKKLQSPDALKGLSLVNTKSDNFGRNARLTTAYHEQIHGAGIKDEELTEGLAKSLMANKLYGRNSETGTRHSQEVAEIAKAMKEGGASTAEVLRAMETEIAGRSRGESKSRADRVLKMESGEKETEKEFTNSGNQQPEVVVDLKGLETKLQGLEKAFKNIKLKDNSVHMTRLFNHLAAVIRKSDLKTQKAMNKLRPDKATTPLELEVIDGEVSQAE